MGIVVQAPGKGALKGAKMQDQATATGRGSAVGQPSSRNTSLDSEGGSRGTSGVSLPRVSSEVKLALSSFRHTFVVTDALSEDMPILYASDGFYKMTGYAPAETVGMNCRFLQGKHTDPSTKAKIKAAVAAGHGFCGRILNYRKDGSSFWNLLTISPIKDNNGNVVRFIGMQVEVTKTTEGDKHDDLRPSGMPTSMVNYDARLQAGARTSVVELLQALQDPSPFAMHAEEPLPPPQALGGLASLLALPRVDDTAAMFTAGDASVQEYDGIDPSGKPTAGFMSLLKFGGLPVPRKSERLFRRAVAEQAPTEEEREPVVDRKAMDLATTLERIEKNFVITDPRLPDNPIIFASDAFLQLTEYGREEILGRNCRFLQGPDTDPHVVLEIRAAIKEGRECTVQLLNYKRSGTPFWNMFHLQPVRTRQGEIQFFIGVQLDASNWGPPEEHHREKAAIVQATAGDVGEAVKDFPDPEKKPEDLWEPHTRPVRMKPHQQRKGSWAAILKVQEDAGELNLQHFTPIRPLGCGDTGSVHLVELKGTGALFALKAMDKAAMIARNKVHRVLTEREVLAAVDHPFLPTLYTSFQTKTHVCLITDFCPGGELYYVLDRQPHKRVSEDAARFYIAEVILAVEYLHLMGVTYRDLKPENILIRQDGHILLTDFDLSFLSSSAPQIKAGPPVARFLCAPSPPSLPQLLAEPTAKSNSFVGTEEYIAPEIISGKGHSSMVDWWALGIFLYEMLYGRTPFRGRNRQRTFANILVKELAFPLQPPVSAAARRLIHQLLRRDPLERLGARHGAPEIKEHLFFEDIDWPLIRSMPAPKLDVPITLIPCVPRSAQQGAQGDLEWDDGEGSVHLHDVF
uniref:non-specific serine/threonine protein kinase n=1 Tax=Entransia fimbriata TaxID=130991 RepID=A0A059UF86_9VIRI|nr:phototropin [Entransia fimbriata]